MDIVDLVKRSWQIGSAARLEGVWRISREKPAPDYYHFLYGLCRVTGAHRILEIGTDYGGSIAAMRTAVGDQEGRFVTVDLTSNSDEQLAGYRDVKKVVGDSSKHQVITEVCDCFAGNLDLLFIDTEHDFENTMCSYGIYNSLLRPSYLVFDDITLNDDMRRFWRVMKWRYGANSINAADVVPEIRSHRKKPGFGIVVARSAAA